MSLTSFTKKLHHRYFDRVMNMLLQMYKYLFRVNNINKGTISRVFVVDSKQTFAKSEVGLVFIILGT